MNNSFYDQLGGVTGVFEQWGDCERTVVMCALVRRLPWSGLKMLQQSVEEALVQEAPPPVECERLERDANDEVLLASLISTHMDPDNSDDDVASLERLVSLVPLAGTAAALALVRAAPALAQRCMERPHRAPPRLARDLLVYLLVHPALQGQHQHQRILSQWLRYLENYILTNPNSDCMWSKGKEALQAANIWASNSTFRRTIGKNLDFKATIDSVTDHYSAELQESFSKNGRDVDISIEEDRLHFDATITQPKSQRSNSLTPPTTNFMQMSSSAENLSEEPFLQKPRSFSLSSEHSLGHLRPMGGVYGTTGSETRLDELRTNNFAEPGMAMVAPWLKSLRLHKYVWLFSNVTYDQMMAMDEEYLEKLGVTRGARHKLLLSIAKLSERTAAVERAAAAVAAGGAAAAGGARRLLRVVRAGLLAPLPRNSATPAALVRLLEAASTALLSGPAPLAHLDAAVDEGEPDGGQYEPAVDPISLHCWLVEKALHHASFSSPELSDALKRMRYRLPPRQFYHRLSDMPPRRAHPPRPAPRPATRRSAAPPAAPAPAAPTAAHTHTQAHDIHFSLDALCLQMTEQAIN